jgi:Yip1 domain
MALLDRVKNICLTPATEWQVIAGETTTPGTLISGYVIPLAAIGAVAGLIGGSVIGRTIPFVGTYRVGLTAGLAGAIFAMVAAVIGVAIVAFLINALAPTFGAEKDSAQAWKVAVYSYTPAWVAGVLNILPLLGALALLAALYGIYIMYLGLPQLMKCPKEKAVGYTAVTVVCAIVVSIVVGMVGAAITGIGMMGAGAMTGLGGGLATSRPASEVAVDKNSPLGRLAEIGKKLDESNKKMEAAQKSGDANAQVAAAFEGLGTLLGGGKHVDPIAIDQLKPFVPATFAGLPKTSSNAEKNGIGGLMVSKAEATYGDGGKRVSLEITDSGGASGLMALAGWATLQQEKEDDNGFERTRKVDGRLVHEKMSKSGGTNEFGIVVGDRFMVSASSSSVDLDALRAAVGSLDLAKLESMKDAGVQK